MKKQFLSRKSIFLISFFVVICDQLSKYLAIQFLSSNNSILLIPHLIQLRLVRNTGAAFSLFSSSTTLLGLLSLCVSIGIIILICINKPLKVWKALAFSFLLGGSFGNGLDRWQLGYVNDFIELLPINFPIFNIADIAINMAVISLIIETINKPKTLNLRTLKR